MLEDIFYAIIAPRPLGKVDHGHIFHHYNVSPFGQGDLDLTYVKNCMTKINGTLYVNHVHLPNQGMQGGESEAFKIFIYAA